MSCDCAKVYKTLALIAGGMFILYVIYFDYSRHHDPEFKNKLKEKRQKQKDAEEKKALKKRGDFPDKNDPQAVNKYVLSQMEKGENFLDLQEYDEAADHFANALSALQDPTILKGALMTTLPPDAKEALQRKLKEEEGEDDDVEDEPEKQEEPQKQEESQNQEEPNKQEEPQTEETANKDGDVENADSKDTVGSSSTVFSVTDGSEVKENANSGVAPPSTK